MTTHEIGIVEINSDSGNISLRFRKESGTHGDGGELKQIFSDLDYDIFQIPQGRRLLEYYKNLNGTPLIIDAGANIGAATVYFHLTLPNCFCFSIEPNIKNFQLLEINTQSFKNQINFLGGLASVDGQLGLSDPGTGDMDFRTHTPKENQTIDLVESICIPTILNHKEVQKKSPLILKIDIEGAEAELFSKDNEWVDEFPLIIIEPHDWMLPFTGSSMNFLKAISKFDFDIILKKENLFLFNNKILKSQSVSQ